MRRFGSKRVGKGKFNPDDKHRVKHSKIGVWDFYQEIFPDVENIPGGTFLEQLNEFKLGSRYVLRMLKDISQLRNCWTAMALYAACTGVLSLLPALALWYSGRLLQIVSVSRSLPL